MSVVEIIVEWIVFPLLDMVSGWNISGKWRISYLFPVATALGLGIWWLGDHFGIVLLIVFGAIITFLFGFASVLTFIPREVASWQDVTSLKSGNRREIKDTESKNKETNH